MTLTLKLPTELEDRLVKRAADQGADPESFVVRLVEQFLTGTEPDFVALSEEETQWFRQVNEVPAPGVRERWRELELLRQTGTLDLEQSTELTDLYDGIEANHARRLAAAAELARLRGVSFDAMMSQLGLLTTNDV